MQNKASISSSGYNIKENWIIDTYRGLFLKKAEEDYVACRILFCLNLHDLFPYHLHQCIEKYLKAYILDKNIEINPGTKNECRDFLINGHKLEKWAEICGRKDASGQQDDFFNNADLIDSLSKITPFETISRYPQDFAQSWTSCPDELIKFFDEFVYEMRRKIRHEQYDDIIAKFLSGYISPHAELTWEFNIKAEQIKEFITFKNYYFK